MDYFGITNIYSKIRNKITPETSIVQEISERDLYIIEKMEQQKIIESFNMREADLEKISQDLNLKAEKLSEERQKLDTEKQNLQSQIIAWEKEKEEIEDYQVKVDQLAEKFFQMDPKIAWSVILELKDDLLILDVLAGIDRLSAESDNVSPVSYIYSLMPKEDSARLLRKSTISDK